MLETSKNRGVPLSGVHEPGFYVITLFNLIKIMVW
jgi:hypothetical protein